MTDIHKEALEYIFGAGCGAGIDWERVVREKLTPPLPLPYHYAMMFYSPWMPIETAPKDGTEFLALNYDGLILHCDKVSTSFLGNLFYSVKGSTAHCSPTHWMPLPKPPS
ncbi:MAG: DUF551 domain-containing protein [Fuscovulum sp.]|nr:MAG: DUF551 domain-containing protein [Fuscovulum sp.]